MASFSYNNGITTAIQIDPKFNSNKIFVSSVISLTTNATNIIQVAGHSVLDLANSFSIEDVQFDNHLLDYAFKLTGERLQLTVNVSKIQIATATLTSADLIATCTLTFDAGSSLINTYTIDDSSNTQLNSVFNFSFSF